LRSRRAYPVVLKNVILIDVSRSVVTLDTRNLHHTQPIYIPLRYTKLRACWKYTMFNHTTVGGTIWLLVLQLLWLSRNRSDKRSEWERLNGSLSRWQTRYAVYSLFVTWPLTFTPSIVYKQTASLPFVVPLWFCCQFSSVASPLNRSLAVCPATWEGTSRHISRELRSSGILNVTQGTVVIP
jgi:hypothetical protein